MNIITINIKGVFMNTVYDLVVSILGDPTQFGEWGPYVAYVLSAFIMLFIVYMILNMFLALFRWLWGR